MGQKRSLSFPFVRGVDQRAAPKMLPMGALDVLHNGRIDQAGKIRRRLGWSQSATLDTLSAAPSGQLRALAPLDGRLIALTSRTAFELGPGETTFRRLSSPTGTPPTIPTPIESFPPEVADAVQSNPVYATAAAEVVCTSLACSADGSIPGWYVLMAWRNCVDTADIDALEQGHLTVAMYRMWVDDFGHRHWEHITTQQAYDSGRPCSQLKAWAGTTKLYLGWLKQEVGGTYTVRGMAVTPRTSPTAWSLTSLKSSITNRPTCWDIDHDTDGLTGVFAVAEPAEGSSVVSVLALGELTPAGDSCTLNTMAYRLAVSWATGGPSIAVATSTTVTLYQRDGAYDEADTDVLATLDADQAPDSIGITQAWEGSANEWRVWWTRPVVDTDTGLGHHILSGQKWNRSTTALVGAVSVTYAPGPLASKPEQWGTYTAAWFLSTHQDLGDRSLLLCALDPTSASTIPMGIASPGQAARYGTYTNLCRWQPAVATDGTPDQYLWGAAETYRGNTTDTFPEQAPRIHCLGVDSMVPPAVATIGRSLRVAEGLATAYGASGRSESQLLQSPGLIAADVGGSGHIAAGTYQYVVVYRTILPDGSEIQGPPSTQLEVVVASADSTVELSFRNPRATLHRGTEWSQYLWADVYRSEAGGTVLYLVGSAGIASGNSAISTNIVDELADSSLVSTTTQSRPSLYTTGGVSPAAVLPSLRCLVTHRDRLFGANGRRLYYSTQRASGTAPYFPVGGFLELHGDIVALASVESGLLIFGRSWAYMLIGDGPGGNLQPMWSPPQPVSNEVGCVSQHTVAYSPELGVTWQSDRGIEVWQGGQIQLFSEPVHKHLATYPIVRAVVQVPEHHQVRWLVTNRGAAPVGGIWVCFDHMHKQWSTEDWGLSGFAVAAASVPSRTAGTTTRYLGMRGATETWSLYTQAAAWFDYSSPTSVYVTLQIKTGTVRPNGLGGWGRLRRIRLLGEPPSMATDADGETLSIYVDNVKDQAGDSTSDVHTVLVPASTSGPNQSVVEIAPATQLCSEFELNIYSVAPSSPLVGGEGIAWTGVAFDWEDLPNRARGVAALRG